MQRDSGQDGFQTSQTIVRGFKSDTAYRAMNLVPFLEQQFRKIGTVLAGNPGNQHALLVHMGSSQQSRSWLCPPVRIRDALSIGSFELTRDSSPECLQGKPYAFHHDLSAKLRFPMLSLDEDDRKLSETRLQLVQVELHFHQEVGAFRSDRIEVNLRQDISSVSYKSCCHVMHRHSGEGPCIKVCAETKQFPSQIPVLTTPTPDVARSDYNVVALQHFEHARQQFRRMRQIRVELDYMIIQFFLEDLLYSVTASRSIPILARPRQQVNLAIQLLNSTDFVGCSVRRVVINEANSFHCN